MAKTKPKNICKIVSPFFLTNQYNIFFFLKIRICVFNQTRLIRYDEFMKDGQEFCNNQKYCFFTSLNRTELCPLWQYYCGPLFNNSRSDQETEISQTSLEDDLIRQTYTHLCHYFKMRDSVKLKPAIPGISSSEPVSCNNPQSNFELNKMNIF